MKLDFRPGTADDIDGLIALNTRYQRNNLTEEEINNGFLSFVYTKSDFKTIIENNDIIVVDKNKKIIGYLLVANSIKHHSIIHLEEKLDEIDVFDKYPDRSRIGIGCQVLIHHKYRGTEVFRNLVISIKKHVVSKYDILYTSIARINHRSLCASKNNGWRVVYENEKGYWIASETAIF